MKTIRFLLAVGFLGSLGLHAQTIALNCLFDAPDIQSLGEATRVTVKDCVQWRQVGAPVLPFRTLRVVLPAGSRIAQLQSRPVGEIASMGITSPVEHGRLPSRSPDPNTPFIAEPDSAGPDPAIYLSNEAYPREPAEVASIQRMEGYDIAILRVFPVQYFPARAELSATRQMTIEILMTSPAYSPGATPPTEIPPQTRARERVMNWVDNPDTVDSFPESGPRYSGGSTYDYLLLTKSSLVASFQPLVNRLSQEGLSVKAESVETINTTVTGRDLPEKIRNYIRQAYTTWGVRYVLLGGDTDTIPCRYAYVNMGSLVANPSLPTDLYYACLDGSWNSDGDAYWGEPNDGEGGGDVDLLAEVYLGRAPVDTPAEVSVFVEKANRYATQGAANPTNALFLAELLAETPTGPAQGGDMFNPLVPLFADYQVSWLDDRFTVPPWVKQDALNAMNQSPHLVLFNGHGDDYTLIGVQQPFIRSIETPDIDLLTNQSPFLAYSVGCNVGQFDNDRFSPDSIGEELVKQHSRGAFAAILNSRLGWYDDQDEAKYSGEFQARFFNQVLINGQTNLGAANQLSKHDLVSQVEPGGIMTYRWCYYEITLFGDPAIAWKRPAVSPPNRQLLIASAHAGASPPAGSLTVTQGTAMTCRVTNSPAAGIPGTQYVCLGWNGTGSVPPSGAGTLVAFTLAQDSQLTWLWKTQLWLSASAGVHGTVITSNGWKDKGTLATVSAVPSRYCHFSHWTGDVPTGSLSNATLQLTMDTPKSVTAIFAENVTSQGVPESWLASFGWTNQFEIAATTDVDNDGLEAWEEYIAGTSPVDKASALRISTLSFSAGSPRLTWPSASGRRYSVWAAAQPVGADFVLLTNNILATPPTNTLLMSPAAGNWKFFRLGVQLNQ